MLSHKGIDVEEPLDQETIEDSNDEISESDARIVWAYFLMGFFVLLTPLGFGLFFSSFGVWLAAFGIASGLAALKLGEV